jgi:hypothetical protein
MSTLTRRRALRLAGLAGLAAVPALAGARLMVDSAGQPQPDRPDYVPAHAVPGAPLAPGAPLIVLTHSSRSPDFGAALVEMLRVEGVLGFVGAPIESFDMAQLRPEHTVLLGAGPLTAAQAEGLRVHVRRGGGLVAMQPDPALVDVFGVRAVSGLIRDGYIRAAEHPLTEAMAQEPLQTHADAMRARPDTAQTVAWMCDSQGARTGDAAVTINRFGEGLAALWAYDLARSVVYTRQGNPAWADQERDGLEGVRASDLFVGWIDLDRIHIPQADEQQRLLVTLLDAVGARSAPLPRLWYFPAQAESMLVATGDSHSNPPQAIDRVLRLVEQRGGTMSIYYTPQPTSTVRRAFRRVRSWAAERTGIGADELNVTASDADAWRARGHELGLHPFVEDGLREGWRTYWNEFTGLGLGEFTTCRTHRVLWNGWVDTAMVQARYGVKMNMDFYHSGPAFQKPDGEWVFGYLTGSGLPMRFADADGRLLNIYQQLTSLVDEQVLRMPWSNGPAKLDVAGALAVSRWVLQRALQGGYAAVGAQFHIDAFAVPGPWSADAVQWLEGTLDYCSEQSIPIWSGAKWASFAEARAGVRPEGLAWDAASGRLMFEVAVPAALDAEMALMLPRRHGSTALRQFSIDGTAVAGTQRRLGALDYATAALPAGLRRIEAIYGPPA